MLRKIEKQPPLKLKSEVLHSVVHVIHGHIIWYILTLQIKPHLLPLLAPSTVNKYSAFNLVNLNLFNFN